MNGEIPNAPDATQPKQTLSPVLQNKGNQGNKGLLFEILFVGVIIILLFGILNYFNILRLSELFPNQLGFLTHRPYEPSKQYGNVTTIPTIAPATDSSIQQAKQTLVELLPTILSPVLLPQSISDITLTEDRENKEKLNASWNNKDNKGGGTTWAVFPKTPNSQKITSVDVFFEKIQTASPSVELAKSEVNKIFSSNPKGEWGCSKDPLNERMLYCENFWEEKDSKKGLGFLIVNTSPYRGRLVFSFCEHNKDSKLYSWKSCRSEFAKSGVE